jgi:nucleotide-binding universal stress UspA family protein
VTPRVAGADEGVQMYRLVVGIDGSSGAATALQWALGIARSRAGAIDAVHAWQAFVPGVHAFATPDYEMQQEAAQAVLDLAVDRAEAAAEDVPVPIERTLVAGSPAATLVERAAGADLAVVGARGLGGFSGLLLGSVSQQLVQHAPCPVIVVPGDWNASSTRRIVVGIDDSDGARAALRWAVAWAAHEEAEVEAVRAFDSEVAWIDVGTPHQERWVEQATATAVAELARVVDDVTAGDRSVTVHQVVEEGAPARVLLDRAKDADLLVVGTRGRGGFAGLLLGSVSQRCAEHGPCPVAVVPIPHGA